VQLQREGLIEASWSRQLGGRHTGTAAQAVQRDLTVSLLTPEPLNKCGNTGRVGDLAGEGGFLTAIRESRQPHVVPIVATHEYSPAQPSKALARFLEQPAPATALLVSSPSGYLTIVSLLAQRGLRVPHDLWAIAREDEPLLDHLIPLHARYACRPRMYARKLVRPVMQVLHGDMVSPRHTRILPTSIGADRFIRRDGIKFPGAQRPKVS
jgi:hypothetical protein